MKAPDGLFGGEEAVLHLIERIVGPLGLRIDESSLGGCATTGGQPCPGSFASRPIHPGFSKTSAADRSSVRQDASLARRGHREAGWCLPLVGTQR